ncbi:glycerate kinase [Spirosomataceae bacterium TFI 002]|nr:glycerate kinase [Spirosomataceae bacterium TFI 002]
MKVYREFMNILIAPDKFKGSLSSLEVCEIIKNTILAKYPKYNVSTMPMADGGEGSLEVLSETLGAEEVKMFVKDSLFRTITASYLRKGNVAFIEMAAASGLQLIKESQRNPLYTTTYGTGQLIKHAVKNRVTEVYLFVGGSATNDAGMGMLQALGFQFLDANGEDLFGIGENMNAVTKIIKPENPLDFQLKVICDVENEFSGKNGAAYVYGPQKGANVEEVEILDQGLVNMAVRFREDLGKDISSIKGSGAAGGIAGGALAGLNTELLPGIETIMQLVDFDQKMKEIDLVITGEGKLDSQTLSGKLIAGVAHKLKENNIPLVVFCGKNELNDTELEVLGVQSTYALLDDKTTEIEAMNNAKDLLPKRVEEWLSI